MKQTAKLRVTYRMEDNQLQPSPENASRTEDALEVVAKTRQAVDEPHDVMETPPNLQQLINELNRLVGLGNVKELVREIRAYVEISRRRQSFQLKNDGLVLHMVFKGNPGTGKTTVARILGKMLAELQVLPKGHLVEVERADLVGEFIGQTAQRTREQLKKAMGGILFIDEAYSLARGGNKDFGKEAIDTLVKAMEDNKNDLILILAGYEQEMEKFLRTNPGLRSRFPIHLNFPDYSCNELLDIALMMIKERQYQLTAGALDYLRRHLQEQIDKNTSNFSNARLVRNLIERAIRRQALRLVDKRIYGRDELMQIMREDLMATQNEVNVWTMPD
ncbi:AAA family ATPase [Dethiobacter alkaliphilus]|uniref:AAA ATPase central domain protein n=1 Tax=Dethiobacter alkaliphilus AHT 1 TaxID=555088 RepID=C0GDR4_DETAL|nr:AAA ATPase central domain protein [Dethiobacter alkaliphilus AHT 1]